MNDLKDSSKMDFTNTQNIGTEEDEVTSEDWIRLIMPRNSRRIKVDDLNRNFWVLGQVISAISAYLFGDDSPLKNIFQKVFEEVLQLWENILYLWIMASLSNLNKFLGFHIDFIPIPMSEFEPYKKYDLYKDKLEDFPLMFDAYNAVANYIKKYNYSNGVIFPYIKINNYQKNYFNKICIPFVFYFYTSSDSDSIQIFYQLLRMPDESTSMEMGIPFTIDPSLYYQQLYCAREKEIEYEYFYPLCDLGTIPNPEVHKFYSGFHIQLEIGNLSVTDGSIVLKNVRFICTDAINEDLKLDDNTKGIKVTYTFNELTGKMSSVNNYAMSTVEIKNSEFESMNQIEVQDISSNTGMYLGDFPSFNDIPKEDSGLIFVAANGLQTDCELVKIGNFLPEKAINYINSNEWKPQHPPEDVNAITSYINNLNPTSAVNDVVFYGLKYLSNDRRSNSKISFPYCRFFYNNREGFDKRFNEWAYLDNIHQCKTELKDNNVNIFLKEKAFDALTYRLEKLYTLGKTNKIIYFMTAIGIQPWYGGTGNASQAYWSQNILFGVFRFIPNQLLDMWKASGNLQPESKEIKFTESGLVNRLEFLGNISGIEAAFEIDGDSNTFHKNGTTTWRLPSLSPIYTNKYDNHIQMKKTNGVDYFIDPYTQYAQSSNLASIYNTYIANPTQENQQLLVDEINNLYLNDANFKEYVNTEATSVKFSKEITSLCGLWTVFDGEDKINEGQPPKSDVNIHYYQNNENYKFREIGYTYFLFKNGNLILPSENGLEFPDGIIRYAKGRSSKYDPNISEATIDDPNGYFKKINGRTIIPDYPYLRENNNIDRDSANASYLWGGGAGGTYTQKYSVSDFDYSDPGSSSGKGYKSS